MKQISPDNGPRLVLQTLCVGIAVLGFSGCGQNYTLKLYQGPVSLAAPVAPTAQTPDSTPTPSPSPSPSPTPPVVCDPLGQPGPISVKNGLTATLSYIPTDRQWGNSSVSNYRDPVDPRNFPAFNPFTIYSLDRVTKYLYTDEYLANGVPVDANFFFSQLNVPTRAFDRAFVTTDGKTILAANNSILYEFFALQFKSRIHLTANDAPGKYQFALLADDGAVLRLSDDGGKTFNTKLVDDDGWHSATLGCAKTPVSLSPGADLPIRVDYYQGPRWHIAIMLLWREWKDDANFIANDPLCDFSSNTEWFDPSTIPSTPQAKFLELQSRGWKVVPAENFVLPEEAPANPCK